MWIIIVILYLLIGIFMVLWDYRGAIFSNGDTELPTSSAYLEKPTFLNHLSIGSALIFVIIWPIKILKKIL